MNKQIAPDDGMWGGNEAHYFGVGESALHCIRVAMQAAGIGTFTNILDLPCGHGRVLRHLQHAFPGARLTACDLNIPGTLFCAATFGAEPVPGNESPGKIALQGNYDLIWVGSLLTHLNEKACTDFLDLFRAHLAPNGLLVVTLHGREVARRMRRGISVYGLEPAGLADVLDQYSRKDFAFRSNHKDQAIMGIDSGYGISMTTPCWVFQQARRLPDMRLVSYTEHGWDGHQDVVSLVRTGIRAA
jgi:SAM-dependent methyltransferase